MLEESPYDALAMEGRARIVDDDVRKMVDWTSVDWRNSRRSFLFGFLWARRAEDLFGRWMEVLGLLEKHVAWGRVVAKAVAMTIRVVREETMVSVLLRTV